MKSERFKAIKLSNVVVHRILESGGDLIDCVIALSDQNSELLKRILELELIVPKKIKTPDGRIMVWHCPDNLLPCESVNP